MTQQHFGRGYGSDAAANYEKYFVPLVARPFADLLMQAAGLQQGERVLDVACGTGLVTRLAAERTGGTAAGLDMNQGMLAVAKAATPDGLSIEWHESSAEAMPLPDESFDVVLCQLSLQLFPDKPAALTEMRRVLTSDGRLALIVPGKMTRLYEIIAAALETHIGPQASGFFRAVFSLDDPEELRGILEDAGFRDVEVHIAEAELDLPAPAEFLWQYIYATPLAQAMSQMSEEQLGAFEAEVVQEAKGLVQDGGVNVQQPGVIATARK